MHDLKQKLYVWLGGLFVAALITADLIGGKFFRVAGIDLSVGMLAFPLTFVLTDVLNEFYGPQGARQITYLGLGTAVFAFVVINIALALPVSPESPLGHDAFKTVFGWSGRLYLASLVAYTIGQLVDITVFAQLRHLTQHRLLWLRATGSTVVSQGIDTLVVNFVLLSGAKPVSFILQVAGNSYLTKLAIVVALTPLIYALHALLGRAFKMSEPVGANA